MKEAINEKGKNKAEAFNAAGTFPASFYGPSASIHCRSSPPRVLDLVQAKLDNVNLEAFRSSCFGKFVMMNKLIHQGPLAYFLLRHLNRASRDEGVLRFNFNGVEACFGPKEYLAITGLSFGPHQELPSSSRLSDIAFGSKRTLRTRDIEKKFKEMSWKRFGHRINLKLALALFAFGALIGPGFVDHAIDMNYLHIFDDIDAVNSFPWGRVSYDIMIAAFYETQRKMDEQQAASTRISVDVNGFALALQIWAYEVFPEIADSRSYMVQDLNIPGPSILRWLSPHKFRYRMFEQLFMCGLPLRKRPFIFTTEEEAEIQMVLLYDPAFGTPLVHDRNQPHGPPVNRKLQFKREDEDDVSEGLGSSAAYLDKGKYKFDLNVTIPSSSTDLASPSSTESLEKSSLAVCGMMSTKDNANPAPESHVLFDLSASCSEVVNMFDGSSLCHLQLPSHDIPEFNVFGSSCIQPIVMFGIEVVYDEEMWTGGTDLKESFNIPGGFPMGFDCEWINEIPPVVDQMKKNSPVVPDYSAETAPSSCASSLISWDRGDRAEFKRRFQKISDTKGQGDYDTASSNLSKSEAQLESHESCKKCKTEGQVDDHDGASKVPKTEPLYTPRKESSKSSEDNGQVVHDRVQCEVVKAEMQSSPTDPAQHCFELVRYSPMKRYPRKQLNNFLNWYHNAKENPNTSRTFRIPLQIKKEVSLDWIRSIYIPGEQLGDEHCDVLLNLLIFKARVEPKMFGPMWTCVEALFWSKSVHSPSFEIASSTMMRYVMGELPLEGALPWCHAVEVFGIAHIFGNHWVAYEIDLLSEKIYVYDSLSESNDWEKVKENFVGLSEYVPLLLQRASVISPTYFKGVSLDPWPVLPSHVAPKQQEGLNDCGVLAIKYLECLASGANVGSIDPRPDSTFNFRRYFCAQLYNGGLAADVFE